MAQGDALYAEGDFPGCAQRYAQAAQRLKHPRPNLLYNLACCQALAGEEDAALVSLTGAVEAGFWDLDDLLGDADLASLRDHPGFPALRALAEGAQGRYARRHNLEIEGLYQAEQRITRGEVKDAPGAAAARRDRAHRILLGGEVQGREDILKAGLILAHSDLPEHLLAAHRAGQRAVLPGQDNRLALWLMATAWDRYLWSVGEAQIYGTQIRQGEGGRYTLEPLDAFAITDENRRQIGLPDLQDAQDRVEAMNGQAAMR